MSISALATSLGKSLTRLCTLEGTPLATFIFNVFARAINTARLRVRIHVKTPTRWGHMFTRGPGQTRGDDTYATPRAEAKYWHVAARYRHRLYGGSFGTTTAPPTPPTASRENTDIPLVTYYTPRLLPLYRDPSGGGGQRRTQREADSVDPARVARTSPRTFCKWHRMVFQDSRRHPTLAQAAVQMKYYSNRDLREIRRIARLLPDEQVFGLHGKRGRGSRRSTKYSEMWQDWLENKGVDLVIVFE